MISVLVSGKVIKPPKIGTGAGGNVWCSASVLCPVLDPKEGEQNSIIVSLIAFGVDGEKLSKLTVGDTVSASGSAKLNRWEKDGEFNAGLGVVANQVLTVYGVQNKKPSVKDNVKRLYKRDFKRAAGGDFDDPITF